MRRLQSYINRYGPEVGPVYYRALQSQAAHAGVSARLRRKIDEIRNESATPSEALPLFPEVTPAATESGESQASSSLRTFPSPSGPMSRCCNP